MKLKNNKGVTLLILTITITVLLIITGITITNSKGQLAIKNVNNLYSDLESISTKVSDYYLKNDSLPVLENTYLNSSNALKLLCISNGEDESLINPNDDGNYYVLDLSKFQKEIIYILRKMTVEEIKKLPDVSEGLENAIKNAANSCNNVIDLVNMVKSKRYTQTRIQRVLIYALLGIDKKMMETARKTVPYTRILGYSERGKKLISEIKSKNPKINLVTSVKEFMETTRNKVLKEMLETDIYATNVYTLGYEKDSWSNLDYTNKIVTPSDLKEVK